MIRAQATPRPNWQARVESEGLTWHGEGKAACWNEDAYYVFTPEEIERVQKTAREVQALHLEAAEYVVRQGLWQRLGLHGCDVTIIQESWERGDWSLHGRFDFLMDEHGQPKLIEYNAETALSLVETGPVQRQWQKEAMPGQGQFNELHERLVSALQGCGAGHIHCAWRPRHPETAGTVRYLASLVREAGLKATLLAMHSIGWEAEGGMFVDQDGKTIECCYKLYPWDWMLREPFARHLLQTRCRFIEPPWRLMLGSKGMLTLLWELFPDHPAILPAYPESSKAGISFVRKPFFGREGSNVCIFDQGRQVHEHPGEHADQPHVWQARVNSPRHQGHQAQLGVWMVGNEPAALGIRETKGAIITGDSPFVPHVVERGGRGNSAGGNE